MRIGELLAFNGWIASLYDPAVRLDGFQRHAAMGRFSAIDRVFETLDTRPEITDAPERPRAADDARAPSNSIMSPFGYDAEQSGFSGREFNRRIPAR